MPDLPLQMGTPGGLPNSGRDHSTAGASLQRDDLSLHADHMLDILELGHDPMDEALSPQLPLHPQVLPDLYVGCAPLTKHMKGRQACLRGQRC